jgi:hypothetical protein
VKYKKQMRGAGFYEPTAFAPFGHERQRSFEPTKASHPNTYPLLPGIWALSHRISYHLANAIKSQGDLESCPFDRNFFQKKFHQEGASLRSLPFYLPLKRSFDRSGTPS